MKYKVGDKVRIKSLDWYNKNKDKDGDVVLTTHLFTPGMSQFCGKVMTIEDVFEDIDDNVVYYMEEIDYDWTDEMIEGFASEIEDNKYFEEDKHYNMLNIVLKYIKEEMYIEPVEYSSVSLEEEFSDPEHIVGYRLIINEKDPGIVVWYADLNKWLVNKIIKSGIEI